MRSPLARVNGSGANKSHRNERKTIEAAGVLKPASRSDSKMFFVRSKDQSYGPTRRQR